MIQFVYGGSGSGKSEFAENLVLSHATDSRFYLATMQVYGEEGKERVLRHKKLREGKGFVTIEQTCDIQNAVSEINLNKADSSIVLLECISNLVANEMFKIDGIVEKNIVVEKIKNDLNIFISKIKYIVIVSNNIFDDGIEYDSDTKNYMEALGILNEYLVKISDEAFEVVAGIPIKIK